MTAAPAGNRAAEIIDHLFRHHAGQMVAVLSRIFGFEKLGLIEDAVQDAMVAALRKWSFSGIPENPTAWLTQTARNRVIDALRRDRKAQTTDDGFDVADPKEEVPPFFSSEIGEDQLRMIFACCHPEIPPDSQVALTLKTVGGFSVSEIASAYLASETAVAKMLTRAKARIRVGRISLGIPVAGQIPSRLDAVLRVLYLMFNEGYSASGGTELVRRDLCFEAVRLIEILSAHPITAGVPKVHAAAALFHFQAARLPARTDHMGELVLLADQDRSRWDRRLIGRGLRHFRLSAAGEELSAFHLEAEIAGIYTLAADFGSTDWARILECYTLLNRLSFSKVAELNRVIVLGQLEGAAAALSELDPLADELSGYNLFHIARGHLLTQLGDLAGASEAYERALTLTRNGTVRSFIDNKLERK